MNTTKQISIVFQDYFEDDEIAEFEDKIKDLARQIKPNAKINVFKKEFNLNRMKDTK